MKYYDQERIKFGTLKNYRSTENADLGARIDPDEGISTKTYNYKNPGHTNHAQFGGIDITQSSNITIKNLTSKLAINAWVYCASDGVYSIDQHRGILYPSRNGYDGNKTLLAYVTLDIEIFLSLLVSLSEQSSQWELVDFGKVDYTKNHETLNITGDYVLSQTNTTEQQAAIFKKPKKFAPENEIRIIASRKGKKLLDDDEKDLFLHVPGLKRCIVDFGPILR